MRPIERCPHSIRYSTAARAVVVAVVTDERGLSVAELTVELDHRLDPVDSAQHLQRLRGIEQRYSGI